MNIVEYVEQALLEPNNLQLKINGIKTYALEAEQQNDVHTLQKLRCSSRFLMRYYQYITKQIKRMNFLAILRDFILFVGRISVPNDIAVLVSSYGETFDLYVEGSKYINAHINRQGLLNNDTFVQQVYGKLSANLFTKKTACGDKTLYKCTGYKKYRSFEQKIAVQTALQMPEGYTLLLSLPTGAGKSLLTQMLAVCGDGLTVAIVPTVALGLDQYRAARSTLKNSLSVEQIACYCGEVNAHEYQKVFDGIANDSLKLLITSPEAIIRNNNLKSALLSAAERQKVTHFVIDESHIVQDWGSLFRPDFQMLSTFKQELNTLSTCKLKTVLLSATLSEDAVISLKTLFSEHEKWIELRCDSLRTEPRFTIEKVNDQQTLQKRVVRYCCILPKPMIIYEIKPEKAEQWKTLLDQEGFSNIMTFTGDTDNDIREEIIKLWSQDKLDIIIATSAFGMGVDKPDVRTVMHTTLPENINRFYQEVGRGGRDGLPSHSILCYCPHDNIGMQSYISNSKVLLVENMIDRWFSMINQDNVERDGDTVLIDTSTPPSSFTESEKEKSGSQNMRWNINLLLFMMRYGLLDFKEIVYIPQQKCYFIKIKMRDVYLLQDKARLKVYLEPLHDLEVQSITSGYSAIKEMASKAGEMCLANYFTQLFPNAPLACGGCPNHRRTYCNDDTYSLHNRVPCYAYEVEKSSALSKLMAGLENLHIVRNENEPWSVSKALQLAEKLNTLGVGILVLPDTQDIDTTFFDGIVLNSKEFELLVKSHPSILSKGVVCAFDDNSQINQIQYRCVKSLEQYRIPVIYYCRENMFITQANRTIRNLLNGNTMSVAEISEV